MTTKQQIQVGYDQMWAVGQNDLRRGDIDVDLVPDATSKRWGISAILRLPDTLSDSLASLVDRVKEFTGKGHTFYDPATFHITLRSIEYFREKINPNDELVSRYVQLLKQLAPSFTELSVQFEGLSANRVGIILQGFPATDQLQLLRQQFHQVLTQQQLLTGPEQQQPRLNAHASLAVYGTSRLTDKDGLVEFVGHHRSTYYGKLTTAVVDIVRYERQLDSVNIVTLDQVVLGRA